MSKFFWKKKDSHSEESQTCQKKIKFIEKLFIKTFLLSLASLTQMVEDPMINMQPL